MKKTLVLLCAVLLCAVFLCPAHASETLLTIATGGEAGVYYPLGQALAKLLTRGDVKVTAVVSGASIANVGMIADGTAQLALVQNDAAFRAVRGQRPFRQPVDNLTMIASLYPEQIQCVTSRGSGIKTISDLRGKRVSVGEAGAGTQESVRSVLSSAGLKYVDVNAEFRSFAETILRIEAGQLDAGFVLAGYPTPAVAALGDRVELELVSFEDELLSKLTNDHPFFTKSVIPAGTYKGVEHDAPTAAITAALVCDAELPDELVYAITKAIFENLPELASAHPAAAAIALDKALSGASIKLHPGAAEYYEENGLDVPQF